MSEIVERYKTDLFNAIELAAKELPYGYNVSIDLEQCGYSVSATSPQYDKYHADGGDMFEEIKECVEAAKYHDKENCWSE